MTRFTFPPITWILNDENSVVECQTAKSNAARSGNPSFGIERDDGLPVHETIGLSSSVTSTVALAGPWTVVRTRRVQGVPVEICLWKYACRG